MRNNVRKIGMGRTARLHAPAKTQSPAHLSMEPASVKRVSLGHGGSFPAQSSMQASDLWHEGGS